MLQHSRPGGLAEQLDTETRDVHSLLRLSDEPTEGDRKNATYPRLDGHCGESACGAGLLLATAAMSSAVAALYEYQTQQSRKAQGLQPEVKRATPLYTEWLSNCSYWAICGVVRNACCGSVRLLARCRFPAWRTSTRARRCAERGGRTIS